MKMSLFEIGRGDGETQETGLPASSLAAKINSHQPGFPTRRLMNYSGIPQETGFFSAAESRHMR